MGDRLQQDGHLQQHRQPSVADGAVGSQLVWPSRSGSKEGTPHAGATYALPHTRLIARDVLTVATPACSQVIDPPEANITGGINMFDRTPVRGGTIPAHRGQKPVSLLPMTCFHVS